jgi:putative ABC transport system permease protein
LTLVLAAIAGISLGVAGIGIMNVMLVSVSERTREIGLMKAIGATTGQILGLILVEATILSATGGALGLGIGMTGARLLRHFYPVFPATPPDWAVAAAIIVSIAVGIVFGLVPARRATRLDPITALARR